MSPSPGEIERSLSLDEIKIALRDFIKVLESTEPGEDAPKAIEAVQYELFKALMPNYENEWRFPGSEKDIEDSGLPNAMQAVLSNLRDYLLMEPIGMRAWGIKKTVLIEKLKEFLATLENGAGHGPWAPPNGPAQLCTIFKCSWDTLKKRIDEGKIRAKKLSSKSYQIHVDDLPKC